MTLIAPLAKGEILFLQYLTGMAIAGNPVLHLYSNNVSPSYSSVIGDLTEVASQGYAPITLVSNQWTTTNTGGVATAVYSSVPFSILTGSTSYGYYVTDTSNNLIWLEQFSGAPFVLPSGGGVIAIAPRITCQ